MKEIVFIQQFPTSRGRRHADMNVYSKQSFIEGKVPASRHLLRLAEVDGGSIGIKNVSLQQFEGLFTREEIKVMQSNGVLNYYPHADNTLDQRYPMFQSIIYQKHGIEK